MVAPEQMAGVGFFELDLDPAVDFANGAHSAHSRNDDPRYRFGFRVKLKVDRVTQLGQAGKYPCKAFGALVLGIQPDDSPFLMTRRDKGIAFALGATCGFVVGLTSVGSGTFFGLVMVLVFPLTLPKIVGTDIFHAAALLWVAGFGHLVAGNVDLRTMMWLLTGSIPGVLLSSQFTPHVPDRVLRLGLASVLMLSGIKLIDFSGADYVIAGGAVVAACAFAAWGLVARAGRRRRSVETPA